MASRVMGMQVVYQKHQFLPGDTIGSLPAESVPLLEQGPESGGIAPVVGELKRQYMDRCTEQGYPLACNPATEMIIRVGIPNLVPLTKYARVPATAAFVGAKRASPLTICSTVPGDPTTSKSFANNSLPGLVIIWVKSDNSGLRVSCRRVVKAGVIKTLSTT